MQVNRIQCEAIEVNTETKICPGSAKMEQGEIFVFDLNARTPKGMCISSIPSVYPMAFAMRLTEKMDWEEELEKDHFDITCPHGAVTYRVSRIREEK